MDVQAATASAIIASPVIQQNAAPAPVAPAASPPPAPSIAPVAGPDGGSSSNTAGASIGSLPGFSSLPPAPAPGAKKQDDSQPITSGVAKLYNAVEQNISVSYRIESDPNEIVTVFTDKQTGKVIVQFPSETLIALAKFFDKLDGAVVNKKA